MASKPVCAWAGEFENILDAVYKETTMRAPAQAPEATRVDNKIIISVPPILYVEGKVVIVIAVLTHHLPYCCVRLQGLF